MNIFKVTYNGLWMGGVAIVVAETPEQAIELVKNHKDTIEFNRVDVELLEPTGVLYNDNGDY
ncbi:hypothetical protein BN79_047 [Yersinia phage phiR2-01]|uniref:Uncharacterized protein n=1 Tax=Yersinia phage phiR2-01 TaxID=1206557 RepID=I7KQT6_9CAUD|nr:hypothetical protein BN79_047 [Yersinia phage phiR2-01]CCI88475.1 hypothetical protein BN79_047 [Yersinia phage phiR2-01]